MPPRKTISAPANRVYKSSVPLKQIKFPEPKKRITYGKKASKRISEPAQDTLTQMDFVKLNQSFEDDDEDLDSYDEEAEKRKRKRRKTEGDQPSSDSKYHTQTLTQFVRSFTETEEEEEDVFDVPSSPRSLGLRRKNVPKSPEPAKPIVRSPSRRKSAPGNMGPPQTPHRKLAQEIPSSQSPVTPSSLHSRTSPLRRSPLKEKSTNIPIHFSPTPKALPSSSKLPKLIIEDTFDTATESQLSRIPTTPSKRSSPAKTVRFDVPYGSVEGVAASPTLRKPSQNTSSQRPSSQANSKFEILDSDAESEVEELEDGYLPGADQGEDEEPESYYGHIGVETQLEAEKLLDSAHTEESQVIDDEPIREELGESQPMESQRLSTQHVNSMAPRTAESDVFISIHPQNVTKILNRTKDHEFRKWRLPPSVSRMWIYETAPTSTLKYMAVISREKRPKEILNESGIGNADFNAKPSDSSNYAYEILELYQLADPLSWAQIHANGWLKVPPTKWSWVRPAVLDRLVANLLPPLFVQPAIAQAIPPSSSTDTQEAEAQLLSDILQFTQPATSSGTRSTQAVNEKDTSYEESLPTTRPETPRVVRSSQASTVDLTQSQTPKKQNLPDVIWESPTRPVPSSTPLELPTPRPQEYQDSDTPIPFSLHSSQLLTKSQMLPESLITDSVPRPPLFIQDSDAED